MDREKKNFRDIRVAHRGLRKGNYISGNIGAESEGERSRPSAEDGHIEKPHERMSQ